MTDTSWIKAGKRNDSGSSADSCLIKDTPHLAGSNVELQCASGDSGKECMNDVSVSQRGKRISCSMTPIWPWSRHGQGETPKASTALDDLRTEITTLPPAIQAAGAFVVGCSFAVGGRFVWSRFGRRVRDAHWVTPKIINRKKMLKGVVTRFAVTLCQGLVHCSPMIASVGDGDNFRFFHTPVLSGYAWPFKFRTVPSINKGQSLARASGLFHIAHYVQS